MMEKLKSIKIDVVLSACLSVAIGVLLIFWPGEVITVLAKVIAVILMASGVALLLPKICEEEKSYMSIIVYAMITLIGLWMFFSPKLVSSLIPIALGVLLTVHGIQDLALAVEGKKNRAEQWWSIPLIGILNIILGVLCICNAFGIVKLAMVLIGIMLVFDGVSDIYIVCKVNKAARDVVDAKITKEENLDDYEDFM